MPLRAFFDSDYRHAYPERDPQDRVLMPLRAFFDSDDRLRPERRAAPADVLMPLRAFFDSDATAALRHSRAAKSRLNALAGIF